jgi:hypothetical protein
MTPAALFAIALGMLIVGGGFALFGPPGGERDGGPLWLVGAVLLIVMVMFGIIEYANNRPEPYRPPPPASTRGQIR